MRVDSETNVLQIYGEGVSISQNAFMILCNYILRTRYECFFLLIIRLMNECNFLQLKRLVEISALISCRTNSVCPFISPF